MQVLMCICLMDNEMHTTCVIKVFMKCPSSFRKGGENVAGVPVRHQSKPWTFDNDIFVAF
jgi:hypothetical protein